MNTDLFTRLDHASGMAPTDRRSALAQTARLGGAAALSMVPFLGMAKRALAANPTYVSANTDFDILNYALTLEYLERSFYRKALATGRIDAGDRPLFDLIERDESLHVTVLSNAISGAGGTPVQFDDDDFTFAAGGTDYLSSYALIKVLAQGFEDTGVRAYKGQAASIDNLDYLTVALQIHSVEARHAAAIRRLNGNQGWIPGDQPGAPAAIAAVYGPGDGSMFPSEDNVTQGGTNLVTALSGYTREQITEAFDEPLGMATVAGENGIATPFITPG
jgi:rubrerythrin